MIRLPLANPGIPDTRSPARLLSLLLMMVATAIGCGDPGIHVGSKNFTESVILGELEAQKLESAGCSVDRRLNLGGTLVCDAAIVDANHLSGAWVVAASDAIDKRWLEAALNDNPAGNQDERTPVVIVRRQPTRVTRSG